jgi:LysM repeat protein
MRRNRARYLAPLALAATITGTYLIVHSALTAKSSITSTGQTQVLQHGPVRQGRLAKQKFYSVQQGDTLSSIASKTGVPVATLETLNPSIVDPNSLQTSQRLRLRR